MCDVVVSQGSPERAASDFVEVVDLEEEGVDFILVSEDFCDVVHDHVPDDVEVGDGPGEDG